ncbi:MAG: hypothetical protein N3G22_02715 [Candidatus Micrarchaeota archaeon]|nr:hypothetical protein [Candidatus Micrarchaeota archaeon]
MGMDLFVDAITLLSALLSLAALYISVEVFKKYKKTSHTWGLLLVCVAIIAFHRISIFFWSVDLVKASPQEVLLFSSIVFGILSLIVFLAAVETKKMFESYRLVEIQGAKRLAEELEKAAESAVRKKRGS